MKNLKRRKKGILTWIAAGSIAAAMTFNVSMGLSKNTQNDLFLANVEALAKSEDDLCEGNYPYLFCPIWTVTYSGGRYSCTTGGPWQCPMM